MTKHDYYSVYNSKDPYSEEYFSGSYRECQQWIDNNENLDEFNNLEFTVGVGRGV